MTTSFTATRSPTPTTSTNIHNSTTTSTLMPDSLLDLAIPRRKKSLPPSSSTSLLDTSDAARYRRLSSTTSTSSVVVGRQERGRSKETSANLYYNLNTNENKNDGGHYHHDNRESSNTNSEEYSLYRKRPRSTEDPRGLARLTTAAASQGKQQQQQQKERRDSGESTGSSNSQHPRFIKLAEESPTAKSTSTSSSSLKDDRRSSVGSVNSTTSSGGGFRRLKKFSPGSKKTSPSSAGGSPSLTVKPPSSLPTDTAKNLVGSFEVSGAVNATEKECRVMGQDEADELEERLAVSDSFQQTQLRLWKMAQEQTRARQEAQEQKRLRKLKKKQHREKLREEQKIKRHGISTDDGDDEEVNTLKPDDESQHNFKDNDAQMKEREALMAIKKMKKKKKLQRLAAEAERLRTNASSSSSPTTSDYASTASSSASSSNKKKKRRLVKMGSFRSTASGDEDGPVKKKVKSVKTAFATDDETTGMHKAATPRTPTLTMALADTVKTRVRACNKKEKDELELLQAASFESKKRRKKNKQLREKMASPEAGSSLTKKKEKKKRLSKMEGYSSDRDDMETAEKQVVKRKRGRPPKHKKTDTTTETVYDADGEAQVAVKRKRGRPPKNKKKIASASDAPSEASSSSATVLAGAAKKKEKVTRVVDNVTSGEKRHPAHPLPFKKRVAAAAAAEASATWEKQGPSSTTASKISLSSAGTGPGATPEFGTEASSISEFTHPLGSMPPPAFSSVFPKPSTSIPREILSNSAIAPSQLPSFDISTNTNASSTAIGPGISSDDSDDNDDSDSSSDSDTDDEELFNFANRMFGTSAKPLPKDAKQAAESEPSTLTPEMCEMERRRQKQEESRTLTAKEINAILNEETTAGGGDAVSNSWVRRSVRQPSRSLLNAPLTRTLLDKLRGNDTEMVVLKMKKYISDPDAPAMVIEAALDALEECTNCEALYIQVCHVFVALTCPRFPAT